MCNKIEEISFEMAEDLGLVGRLTNNNILSFDYGKRTVRAYRQNILNMVKEQQRYEKSLTLDDMAGLLADSLCRINPCD